MTRPRIAVVLGLVASIVAIVATVAAADGVRASLANAYDYPNAQGLGLDEAASMTMTYLLAIGVVALVVASLYLFVRPIASSRAGWWIGAVIAALGLALAIYDATQELPVLVKIVHFLPVAAGIAWLAMPGAGTRGDAAHGGASGVALP